MELVRQGNQMQFLHSMLFSNGWEAEIPFREVGLATALAMFPQPARPKPELEVPTVASPSA
jgi:hypothetical protein